MKSRAKFDLSDPWKVFFRDPRFTEQARYVARNAFPSSRDRLEYRQREAVNRFADSLIKKLREGKPPLVNVTPTMRGRGITEEIADQISAAVLDFAAEHVRLVCAAATHETGVLGMISTFHPAPNDPDNDNALREIFTCEAT